MNFDILDLITNCVFWVFIAIWFSFFVDDGIPKIIGIVAVCLELVIALVGKYITIQRLME